MSAAAEDAMVHDLDSPRVRTLIRSVRHLDGVGARVAESARLLLGAPYREAPLGGSPSTPEELTVALDGFDCVTYVEYTLALARSASPDQFVDLVRKIRYAGGVVGWSSRNHYMTAWIRNNARAGLVDDCTRGPGVVERERELDIVDGLRPRRARVRSVPKREFARRLSGVSTGDIAFFASTRRHTDIFHCGILVVDPSGDVRLRHAARSRGRVVEQSLSSFLDSNRMSGVILVRPTSQ